MPELITYAEIIEGDIIFHDMSIFKDLKGTYSVSLTPAEEMTRKQQNSIFGILREISGATGMSMDSIIFELEQDTGIRGIRHLKLSKSESDLCIKALLNKAEFWDVDIYAYMR